MLAGAGGFGETTRRAKMGYRMLMWSLIAGVGMWLMELSYVPQLFRMWKIKDARGISVLFPSLNIVGRFLAMLYTWHAGELVLATGFMVGWTLRVMFLSQIVYYQQKNNKNTNAYQTDGATLVRGQTTVSTVSTVST
jgi:uncharacterized protein with PQ loop repeat